MSNFDWAHVATIYDEANAEFPLDVNVNLSTTADEGDAIVAFKWNGRDLWFTPAEMQQLEEALQQAKLMIVQKSIATHGIFDVLDALLGGAA